MAKQQQLDWDKQCSQQHLARISTHIDDWRAISPFLWLSDADEMAILGSAPHSVPAQRIAMLRKWNQKLGTKATYKQLYQVFEQCGRADLMDVLKGMLSENSSEEGEGLLCVL